MKSTDSNHIQSLRRIKADLGHLRLPKASTPSGLVNWCSSVRAAYRDGRLDPEVEDALREIGFSFTPRANGSEEDIAFREREILAFRSETGKHQPTKSDKNKRWDALAQWIQRKRREHDGGSLHPDIKAFFIRHGLPLLLNGNRAGAELLHAKVFDANYEKLKADIDRLEAMGKPRNLTWSIARAHSMRDSYSFVDNMLLKTREGSLTIGRFDRMCRLQFDFNGVPIREFLSSGRRM